MNHWSTKSDIQVMCVVRVRMLGHHIACSLCSCYFNTFPLNMHYFSRGCGLPFIRKYRMRKWKNENCMRIWILLTFLISIIKNYNVKTRAHKSQNIKNHILKLPNKVLWSFPVCIEQECIYGLVSWHSERGLCVSHKMYAGHSIIHIRTKRLNPALKKIKFSTMHKQYSDSLV